MKTIAALIFPVLLIVLATAFVPESPATAMPTQNCDGCELKPDESGPGSFMCACMVMWTEQDSGDGSCVQELPCGAGAGCWYEARANFSGSCTGSRFILTLGECGGSGIKTVNCAGGGSVNVKATCKACVDI